MGLRNGNSSTTYPAIVPSENVIITPSTPSFSTLSMRISLVMAVRIPDGSDLEEAWSKYRGIKGESDSPVTPLPISIPRWRRLLVRQGSAADERKLRVSHSGQPVAAMPQRRRRLAHRRPGHLSGNAAYTTTDRPRQRPICRGSTTARERVPTQNPTRTARETGA